MAFTAYYPQAYTSGGYSSGVPNSTGSSTAAVPDTHILDLFPGKIEKQPKTNIFSYAPTYIPVGAAVGSGLGLIADYLMKKFRIKNAGSKRLAILGAVVGSIPGAILTLNQILRGGALLPMNHKPSTWEQFISEVTSKAGTGFHKYSAHDPGIYSEDLWKPTFPVAQSIGNIRSNTSLGPFEQARQISLIAEAGRQQGVGLSGLASPGALRQAATKFVGTAIPAAGTAMLAAKMLGAPSWIKKTGIGAALTYSALKSLLNE